MELNIKNETGKLKTVVLGMPLSNGAVPTLEECYDAKSYHTLLNDTYPTQEDITSEMENFKEILNKYGVKVYRPKVIENYNQVFARDVAFVIEDKMIISNLIDDRADEQEAYKEVFEQVNWKNIINLPSSVNVEGGDVMPYNDYIFVGTYVERDFNSIKTARTNKQAIRLLQDYFPEKKVIRLELNKNDKDPFKGILHLDCTFNIVGGDKCIIYKKGFKYERDYEMLVNIFGKENCFEVTEQEMFEMNPNIFSISPKVVVSDSAFTRMNEQLRKWGITVEEIKYREISKMGGLLRCSTMPLVRE